MEEQAEQEENNTHRKTMTSAASSSSSLILTTMIERLRPLVGIHGWDYAVVWKLFYRPVHHQGDPIPNRRYIEFMACCCAGAEDDTIQQDDGRHGDGGDAFAAALVFPRRSCSCRDVAFQHSPVKPCCQLVSRLPFSIHLDDDNFGIHGQTLLSNQPKWLNFSTSSTSSGSDPTTASQGQVVQQQEQDTVTVGTKALIPVPGGLIELFVSKQIPEDQDLIDFITAQFSSRMWLLEPEPDAALVIRSNHSTSINVAGIITDADDTNYSRNDVVGVMDNLLLTKPYPYTFGGGGGGQEDEDVSEAVSPSLVLESLNRNQVVRHEISVDRIELFGNSPNPMNFVLPPPRQATAGSECPSTRNNNPSALDHGSSDTFISCDNNKQQQQEEEVMVMDPFSSTLKDAAEFQDMDSLMMGNTCSSATTPMHIIEGGDIQHFLKDDDDDDDQQQQGNDQKNSSVKQEANGRSGSISDCSDQIDDEDDPKHRVGRSGKGTQCKNLVAERRRRKKLNDRLYSLRALVPKISKLDRASILGDAIEYVKELQKQAKALQDELEEEGEGQSAAVKNNTAPQLRLNHNGYENGGTSNASPVIHNQDSDITTMATCMSMEPQVEVIQIGVGGGNEMLVKVFWEHKAGGFVTLLEALQSIGFRVTYVNVTRFISLVSNVFHVESRDGQLVEADDLRDSLLEITRNSSASASGRWSEASTQKPPEMASAIGSSMDQQPPQHHHLTLHNMHTSSFHHLQHLHNQS